MKECAPYITYAPKDGGGVCHNNTYLGIKIITICSDPFLILPLFLERIKDP